VTDIVLRTNRTNSLSTIMAALEEIAAELYSYAADEYNLARVSGEPENERFLNAYNHVTEAIVAIERTP
jgi:hypothetical protein